MALATEQNFAMSEILAQLRDSMATRRCVTILYKDETRLIEPHGLHTSKDGSLLLKARKCDTGEVRTYRVDRIDRAEPTDLPFSPVNQVRTETGAPVQTGYPF